MNIYEVRVLVERVFKVVSCVVYALNDLFGKFDSYAWLVRKDISKVYSSECVWF